MAFIVFNYCIELEHLNSLDRAFSISFKKYCEKFDSVKSGWKSSEANSFPPHSESASAFFPHRTSDEDDSSTKTVANTKQKRYDHSPYLLIRTSNKRNECMRALQVSAICFSTWKKTPVQLYCISGLFACVSITPLIPKNRPEFLRKNKNKKKITTHYLALHCIASYQAKKVHTNATCWLELIIILLVQRRMWIMLELCCKWLIANSMD